VQAGAFAVAASVLEQRAQLVLDRFHLADQAPAVLVLLKCVPGLEQPLGHSQAGLAELSLLGEALGVAEEVALEVLPARLA